jgi:protein-tyrosine phosphatase
MKTKILFVCLGNICRSPAADGIMKALTESQGVDHLFDIDSAGIGSWHVGQLPDRRMREHGARRGYDFNHHARQVKPADFDRFDLILTMDDANFVEITGQALTDEERAKVVPLARFLRHHPQAHDIPDPYYGGDAGFERVIALLEDACEGLLDELTKI